MANIFLDFKDFKHEKTDDKSTTLRHKKLGHTITLAHNVLSDKNKKALMELSKIAKDTQTENQKQEAEAPYGKVVQKYAQGGEPRTLPLQSEGTPPPKEPTKSEVKKKVGESAAGGKPNPPATDLKSAWYNLTHGYAEGGRVPAPAGESTNQGVLKDVAKSSQQGTKIPSSDTMIDRLKNAWAEGGEIPQQPDIAAQQQSAVAKASLPPTDPNLKAKKDLYNFLIGSAGAGSSAADMFGPNGENPASPVNPTLWAQVENSPHISQMAAQQAADRKAITKAGPQADEQQAEHDNALAQNVVNAKVGASLVPDPGSPQIQPEQSAQPRQAFEEGGMAENMGKMFGDYATMPVRALGNAAIKGAEFVSPLIQQAGEGAQSFVKGAMKGAGIPDQPEEAAPAPEQPTQPSPEALKAEQDAQLAQQPRPQEQPKDQTPDSMSDYQNSLQKAEANELAGTYGKAKAIGALGEAQAKIHEAQVNAQRDAQSAFQNNYSALNQERIAHIQDIQNGYIDPNKYWTGDSNGNGSHSRIATGIGMILAGFNPSNKPNAAIDFLKHQMEMNLDAQKQNLNSKNNLLRANIEQFHNLKDATDMTRLMQADIVQNQLLAAADKASNPIAKAEAQSKAGMIQKEYAPLQQQFAMRRALMNLSSGSQQAAGSTGHMLGYMDAMNPEMAKQYRSRYYAPFDVPGAKSIADRELPDSAIRELGSHEKFNQAAGTLAALVQKHRGGLANLDPTSPDRVLANQQAMILQSLFREGTLGTVYREGEQPLLDKAIKGEPLSLLGYFSEIPKIHGLMRNNQMARDVLAQSYGLKPPKSASIPADQDQSENIQTRNGIKYKQQGNYMVPVK